jgi:hypothetical protein
MPSMGAAACWAVAAGMKWCPAKLPCPVSNDRGVTKGWCAASAKPWAAGVAGVPKICR